MLRLAGLVLDFHDDLDGAVLRSVVPRLEDIPSFVKTASRLSSDQLDRLPDDQFALVLLDDGRKLKKYAMVDPGNTALSVLYLIKQAHLLPPPAVKVAAANLLSACGRFGIPVPTLVKVAAYGGEAASSQFQEKARLGKQTEDRDVIDRTNYTTQQGSNYSEIPTFFAKEKVMPYPMGSQDAGATKLAGLHFVPRRSPAQEKVASEASRFFTPAVLAKLGLDANHYPKDLLSVQTRMRSPIEVEVPPEVVKEASRYVDVSGWTPARPAAPEAAAPERTLLDGRYPVDSMDQVKTASAYFLEHWTQFAPEDRHRYCVKLAARMEELSMEVPELVGRYGGTDYADDVEAYLSYRRSRVPEVLAPSLDALVEKRASISPENFAVALAEFDKIAGLRWSWDGDIPDPWRSTFGPSKTKQAAKDWSYSENGAYTNEGQLQALAMNGHWLISKNFGQEFADRFQRDPKKAFESLPKISKLVLARLASDRHAGTATE